MTGAVGGGLKNRLGNAIGRPVQLALTGGEMRAGREVHLPIRLRIRLPIRLRMTRRNLTQKPHLPRWAAPAGITRFNSETSCNRTGSTKYYRF